jgi:hypothetical protein
MVGYRQQVLMTLKAENRIENLFGSRKYQSSKKPFARLLNPKVRDLLAA